jgi:hypothetical protein
MTITHDHGVAHSHAHHDAARKPQAVTPGLSLLRLAAWQRLMGVAAVLAVLWTAVFWAMT